MLSICCVTRGEPYALWFLQEMVSLAERLDGECVIGFDVADGWALADDYLAIVDPPTNLTCLAVHSAGFIESVLDEVLAACHGDYVLRLDDDERCSPAMVRWLLAGDYRTAPHWSLPRANLWAGDRVIMNPPLWPNYHERLSVRSMAGGRAARPHARSPHGRGTPAPVCFEHHKFLVKSYAERAAVAARYDAVRPGLGTGHDKPYSLPEDVYAELELAALGDGTAMDIFASPRTTNVLSNRGRS